MKTSVIAKRFFILSMPVAALLTSCDTKEKQMLQAQVETLESQLAISNENAKTLEEVGVLIDSIDANRKLLRTDVIEGTTYANYAERLKSINEHVRKTEDKIASLEESLKKANSNSGQATIKRLRADLAASTKQLEALQQEVEKVRGENEMLAVAIKEKDSALAERAEVIKMKESDVANLEKKVEDITVQSTKTQADMFYAQAEALETAAARTKFAPRKKKDTQREALELYKISLSLGNFEAQKRITELEKVVG
jgi:chromosome segregation ATPase